MRPIRLAAAAVIVAPLLLTACLPLPTVPPAQSQPAPSTPVSTEPAQPSTSPSAPAPSTPTTSEPTESTEPAGDGDFELVLDGTPIDSPWVADITCYYSSGFGAISNESDGDTDYFSALLGEEGGSISASLVVLSDGGESYLGTGENASLTLEGGQISGTIELTSNFSDTATLEISGSCGA